MSKIMQNLIVLMEPSEDASETSLKAGNMILNRFCIDEDAAFELSGVNYLKNIPFRDTLTLGYPKRRRTPFFQYGFFSMAPYQDKCARGSENMRNVKGKEYSF